MVHYLVSDVLEKPFCGNFPTKTPLFGEFIDPACNRKKLRALNILALRVGNILVRFAAALFTF